MRSKPIKQKLEKTQVTKQEDFATYLTDKNIIIQNSSESIREVKKNGIWKPFPRKRKETCKVKKYFKNIFSLV